MAIDEKKAILRGLSATAQQVREAAAAPEIVAQQAVERKRADVRYQIFSSPLLLLPAPLAILGLAIELGRFYAYGAHWGTGEMMHRYAREGFLLFAAGLLLCGTGFLLLYLFREVAGRKTRIAAMVGSIAAGVLPLIGVFFLHAAYLIGREHAYKALNYPQLVMDADTIRRDIMELRPGTTYGTGDAEWAKIPAYTRAVMLPTSPDAMPIQLTILDQGVVLLLDNGEGLLIPLEIATGTVEDIANENHMTLRNRQPPVIYFEDFKGSTLDFQEILNRKKALPWP